MSEPVRVDGAQYLTTTFPPKLSFRQKECLEDSGTSEVHVPVHPRIPWYIH
jgi:hypothetical protein